MEGSPTQALSIVDSLFFWATTTPDAIALLAPQRPPLTYRQLATQCVSTLQSLRSLGLGRNDAVAMILPAGAEMAVALLAVAAGAVAAPLNPAYRATEVDFYLADLDARALLVQTGQAAVAQDVARARGIPVIELTVDPSRPAGVFDLRGRGPLQSHGVEPARADDLALLLHTSGTTSRPKLVPLTHGNLHASAQTIQATLQLTRADRCLNIMPLFHIHGLVGALLASLAAGGSVVCTPGFTARQFFRWLADYGPTWYTAVPTMHQAILAQAQATPELLGRPTLRLVRSSSAPLPPTVLQDLEALFTAPVIEAYGMTEAAHQMASNPLPPEQRKIGSVGKASGLRVAIMDAAGQLLPPGTQGEVVIQGANVMAGYRNHPTANPMAFVQGWLRTGDQGYIDTDGYLFLTGRLKEQINRGGEKISPHEVDAALLEHPNVAQAVTFAVPHPTLGEDVAAAVVLRKPAQVTATMLRHGLFGRLADFKIPSQVLLVDAIPQGATGKVQRSSMATHFAQQLHGPKIVPQHPLQRVVTEIYAEILGLVSVGAEENFFTLGGDSLQAARAVSRLQERLGIPLSVAPLFAYPTAADLATRLEGMRPAGHKPWEPVEPPQRHGPLSYGQEALWFLDQLEPGNPVYNRPMFWRLQGPLHIAVLERCLHTIQRRHSILRTSFPVVDGQPMQSIADDVPLALAVVDLSAVAASAREETARQLATVEAQRPFHLARGPLVRAQLLRLDAQTHILLVTTHHIVSDGWSAEILRHELRTLYQAFAAGQPSPLPELPMQYVDFARWQRAAVEATDLQQHLAYWQQQLEGDVPVLSLSAAHSRSSPERRRGANQSCMLSLELVEKLKTLSQQEHVTLFMTLLAAFKTLLYACSGQEDIIVGTPFFGRGSVPSETLIGCFINTLPLRTRLSHRLSFRELLRRVRGVTLDAQAHQAVPFEKIVASLRRKRDSQRLTFYQVLFQLRNYPRDKQQLRDLCLEEYRTEHGKAFRDLSLDIREVGDGLWCRMDYDVDLFSPAMITRLLGEWQNLLVAMVANPEQRLSELAALRWTPQRDDRQPFTCCIIGETSLPMYCADLLWQAGHTIQGIITADATLRRWAQQHQVPVYHPQDGFAALLEQPPCDYLFSIFNLQIVPETVLAWPRHSVINYHDGPLPRYAGLHAPTWALLHGESQYGVTWHAMTKEIDAGDILGQAFFDIAPDETSLSLNARCHEAALASFRQLLIDLEQQQVCRKPQDLAQRTYFSHNERPPAGAVLDWRNTAQNLDMVCRALAFGPYLNPLGCPKLYYQNDFFIVAGHTLQPSPYPIPAGTVRSIDDSGCTIATLTADITITELRTLEGEPVPLQQVGGQEPLRVGTRLASLAPAFAAAFTREERRLARHEAFWRQRFATLQPLQLPYTAQAEPKNHAPALMPVVFRVPQHAQQFLPRPWQREQLLLTVLAVYLARVSATQTFDIGFTSLALWQRLRRLAPLGDKFLAARVPLRIQVAEEWSFEQVYAALAAETALCIRHQTYPRDLIARDPDVHALPPIQRALAVTVVMLPAGQTAAMAEPGGLTLSVETDPEQDTDKAGTIAVTVAYYPAATEPAMLTRMVGHMQVLLEAAVTNPTQAIAVLPILSTAERQQLLLAWNDTACAYPAACVQQLFAEQVEKTPHAIAVVSETAQLTYRQLNQRANQLAHYLQKCGAQAETLVGLCVERSLEMLIGLLGILKSGAAYVPLDPTYPVERLRFMLADMQAPVLVTCGQSLSPAVWSALDPHPQVVRLDTDWPRIAQESPENPSRPVRAEQLAYGIYTSGSTGHPKGVTLAHQALSNFVAAACTTFALQPTDRVLQFASSSFDTALEEIFPCLLSGATLVLRTAAMMESPAAFLQQCRDAYISVWDLPTAYWHDLTVYLANNACTIPESLRLVIIGGETALLERLQQWRACVGERVRLLNTYGPTEATVVATMWDASNTIPGNTVPIGRPIANVRCYIVDKHLQPVPSGVPGELCLGGAGLARGYLRRPELTAAKFVMHAFAGEAPQRLYRTGDLVRACPDGTIEILGRIDEQVKIRGFRIELGEIEAVLAQHPAVQGVVVVARQESAGEQRLVAYLVRSGTAVSVSELRQFLQSQLPEFMIPATFVYLDALPRTSHGKIDRQALPAPEPHRPDLAQRYVAPQTATEALLAAIWAEVLKVERVGIHDNFFELGGHSLLATMVMARINACCQVAVPLRALFQLQTVAALAHLIDIQQQERLLAEIEALSDEEVARLLTAQAPHAQ